MTVSDAGAASDVPVPDELANNVLITNVAKLLDPVYNWSRRNSLWPLGFRLWPCFLPTLTSHSATSTLIDRERLSAEKTGGERAWKRKTVRQGGSL